MGEEGGEYLAALSGSIEGLVGLVVGVKGLGKRMGKEWGGRLTTRPVLPTTTAAVIVAFG